MEAVTGALPSVLTKLGDLLVGEYNLQKGVKGEIRFLKAELESMKGALEKVSATPRDQLDIQDKIWAKEFRELFYDIEDTIDNFMVRGKGNKKANLHGIKKFIDRSVGLFRKAKVRHGIATEIKELKSRIDEVAQRRERNKIENQRHQEHVTIDPRLPAQYKKVTELVGIDEARDELIKILMEGNVDPTSKEQDKIVSIVGFGGLGKTTIANVVYEKIRARFECSAFVSVSQTLDLEKLLKDMFYQLAKQTNESINVTRELREFLQDKRYFIVIDDIWNISHWEFIKCALPGNNVENKIITTTRILSVAEKAGGTYKLQPLSLYNSQKLFFRRIFGTENKDNNEDIEKCPDDELAEISDRILKKCAGVPLAIITMAGLLADEPRNKLDWYEVYNNIGTGLEDNLDVENMRKILSYSYYELPCYLRTCLLYLSMFPEDYNISKDDLIRMWIAEGFIQCAKQRESLFELGENYFNELINRSMIMPIYNDCDLVDGCRVHDMVLDLIRSLSTEENFTTVLNDIDHASPSNTIRRLSLQSGKESQVTSSLEHARSVVVFPYVVAQVPALDSCQLLRVLDLQHCYLSSQDNGLKSLGNLYHLRYLGLQVTGISQLPEEIGNLQFLQTLDTRKNIITRLPSAVVQLRNLMFLYSDSIEVTKGIGNLTCLEQLSWLGINDSSTMVIEELGQLTELRKLSIYLYGWSHKVLDCLHKLQKIQELEVIVEDYVDQRSIGGLDDWIAPQHIRVLRIRKFCWFSTLPAWVNPSFLLLNHLSIAVRKLHHVDLKVLGSLPALRSLALEVDRENPEIHRGFVVGAGFPCLVHCCFCQFVWPVVFQHGAMPRLTEIVFEKLYLREAREIASSDGGLDLGLENLSSLQEVFALLDAEGAGSEEAQKQAADIYGSALRHAVEMHPNHPTACIRAYRIKEGKFGSVTF